MNETSVVYAEDSGLALVTLAESKSGNRLNPVSIAALHDALNRAEASAEARIVILRSNGSVFCDGMDFGFFQESEGQGEQAGEAVRGYARLLLRMRAFPKLIIALVDGAARAGGVGIVAAADLVLASARSSFQLSEIFIGIIPANVLPFLAERVGAHRAAAMTLSGETFTAEEARTLGLADKVLPDEALEKETRAYIRNLLRASPYALGRAKSFAREIAGVSLQEASDHAQKQLLAIAARPAVRDAIAAFAQGSLPAWSARLKLRENLWIGENHD
ncbi:MAG: enoyl-CoA hydratase/isomerase family protein [Spirochaetota bacterium]|jgi:enoyl-CoA hydratase/carnithine racemase|nr:enoyl-CoA hydratase/isomerase family protein [Spirochaetota bacterium]